MKAYRVEEMQGDAVIASHAAEAKTPFQAAEKALGLNVTLRGDADTWIRVVDLTERPKPTRLRPAVFEYRAIGGRK